MKIKQIVQVVVLVGAVVGAVVLFLGQEQSPAASEFTQLQHFKCSDETCGTGFSIPVNEIASGKVDRSCPTCGNADTRDAYKCAKCGEYGFTGPNGILPVACDHCGENPL